MGGSSDDSGAPPKFNPNNPPAGLKNNNYRTVSIKKQMEEINSDFDFDNESLGDDEKDNESSNDFI